MQDNLRRFIRRQHSVIHVRRRRLALKTGESQNGEGVFELAGVAGSRSGNGADEHVVVTGPGDAGTDDAVLPEVARGERHARSLAGSAKRAACDGQGTLRSPPGLLLGRVRSGGSVELREEE